MAFDIIKFTDYLRQHAAKVSQSHCAKFVRRALEAGGANTSGHLVGANTYGPILRHNGFHVVPVKNLDSFLPAKGDIVIIEPTRQGNQAGHIAGFDGKNWISDFVQRGFWPGSSYAKEKPTYVIYRH